VETITALIACGSDDKNAVSSTVADSISEERMCCPRRGELASANVDDMGAVLNRL